MSLQMMFSRIQGTNLTKLKTKEIGDELKGIVENSMQKLIETYRDQQDLYDQYLERSKKELYSFLSEPSQAVFHHIHNMNLSYDFEKIAYQVRPLPYNEVIILMKLLSIKTMERRADRQNFFFLNPEEIKIAEK